MKCVTNVRSATRHTEPPETKFHERDEDLGEDAAVWPLADSKYRVCVSVGSETLTTSLLLGCCSKETYEAYYKELEGAQGTERRAFTIHGNDLFVTVYVAVGNYVMDYTAVLRSGASARALHRALGYRGLCPHGLVTVNVNEGN